MTPSEFATNQLASIDREQKAVWDDIERLMVRDEQLSEQRLKWLARLADNVIEFPKLRLVEEL